MSKRRILVTGGAGFIGSHFVRFLLNEHPDYYVVNLDALTYAGNLENLKDVARDPRYVFYKTEIGDYASVLDILKKEKIDTVVNFAAESDNNKATTAPIDFARTNMLGTTILLEAARVHGIRRFHHISTCEVFGQLPLESKIAFNEESPLRPRTPYNASKGGADLMAKSYFETFGMPITISYCANNYGTHQFPEKVIPVFIIKALSNEPLPVFKSTKNRREWIHVSDHCRAIDTILEKGVIGEGYNIGTGFERSIEDLAKEILILTGKPETLQRIVPDRPGHDTRYLLDSAKTRSLGWSPRISWSGGLKETVEWYKKNSDWWQSLLPKARSLQKGV